MLLGVGWKEHVGTVWSDEKAFILIKVVVTRVYTFTKIHLRFVHFTTCKFYPSQMKNVWLCLLGIGKSAFEFEFIGRFS